MSRGPRLMGALVCVGAISLASLAAVPAGADVFGPISLASEGSLNGGAPEQAEYAHDAAISGNGEYVAFDGSFGGKTGVWRRDLATGAIEQVAGGDAELPSISRTGRYISFTSSEDLTPEDKPHGVNVWVRDMEPGPGEPPYILVSAVNGSNEGLTYEYIDREAEEQEKGSEATGRSALGENSHGLEVAFVTTAISNLVRYPELEKEEEEAGKTPKPHTPALQVAVRYLGSRETVLVSGAYDPVDGQTTAEPVPFGAVYPGTEYAFHSIPSYGMWKGSPPPGASISADGSTVAWMGRDIDQQAQMLSDEKPSVLYTEPLWRRIEPGSQTPTERVTGGSEPANPACEASGESALPLPAAQSAEDPCQGPFRVELLGETLSHGLWADEQGGPDDDFVPRLSADGYTVAFIASALPIGLGTGFGGTYEGQSADLYVANMQPGLTRKQALTPVTQLAGAGVAGEDPITDFDISPDGSQVAFTTRRTEFPLGSPAYISAQAAVPGESELFDADLEDNTLTQVTHGYEGGPSFQPQHGSKIECTEDLYCGEYTEGAQSPSFSEVGLIAFSSTASNLVYGDGNTPPGSASGSFDGSDAFFVEQERFTALPTPQSVSPAPEPALQPAWSLGVTARSRPNGSVLLYVQAPAAGAVRAGAQSAVPAGSATAARAARRGRDATSASRAREGGKPAGRAVVRRTVATRSLDIQGAGLSTLTLALASPYTSLSRARGGLSATVTVTFTAPGHPVLHESVLVTFVRKARKAKTHGRAGRSARASRPSTKTGRR